MPARTLIAFALLALASVGGCSLLPGPTASPTASPTLSPIEAAPEGSILCLGLARDVCEFAVERAEETGLSLQQGESVVSRTVRKTKVVMCDGILEPLFDVTFEIAPSGMIVVTVGKLPDGRLFACTY